MQLRKPLNENADNILHQVVRMVRGAEDFPVVLALADMDSNALTRPNNEGKTSVHIAIELGYPALALDLCKKNNWVSGVVDHEGNAPLHALIGKGSSGDIGDTKRQRESSALFDYLVEAYPHALFIRNKQGYLPFVDAVDFTRFSNVKTMWPDIEDRPSCLTMQGLGGQTFLHHVVSHHSAALIWVKRALGAKSVFQDLAGFWKQVAYKVVGLNPDTLFVRSDGVPGCHPGVLPVDLCEDPELRMFLKTRMQAIAPSWDPNCKPTL